MKRQATVDSIFKSIPTYGCKFSIDRAKSGVDQLSKLNLDKFRVFSLFLSSAASAGSLNLSKTECLRLKKQIELVYLNTCALPTNIIQPCDNRAGVSMSTLFSHTCAPGFGCNVAIPFLKLIVQCFGSIPEPLSTISCLSSESSVPIVVTPSCRKIDHNFKILNNCVCFCFRWKRF